MGSTLYHFESYKTLGPKTGLSLMNFTLHIAFKHLSDDTQRLCMIKTLLGTMN
jgi:hypothetical protein